jgi:Fe-S cluster assembly protein SufB
MLEWRLDAYRRWQTMTEPTWARVHYPKIDFQELLLLFRAEVDRGAEEPRRGRSGAPRDLREARHSAARARDARRRRGRAASGSRVGRRGVRFGLGGDHLQGGAQAKAGVIFCSISEAVREHPELVKKYLGTVVPVTDNFYATLNSAVFSDGSFVYIPPGVRCPMELSTYFRINERNTGQFERTLIIADKGAYVSYLEGCTAPMRDENQLHAAVVELVALDDAEIKYSTVQNWYPGERRARAASTTSSPSAATAAATTRRSRGPRSRPARRSPGSIRAASCAATIPAASSIRSRCRTATSRSIPAPR